MAPWVPTRKKDIEKLLEILDLQAWETFLEIGCGDGRVSHAVARKFTKSKILGIEIALPVFIWAYMRWFFTRLWNYEVRLWNAFKEDFWAYDVIYVYGLPKHLEQKIIPKFEREAKIGSKLISYVFSVHTYSKLKVTSHGTQNEAKLHILKK